jgi:N-acetylglucosaminyldiphosphoundecaprenol N-acetyl-beta-D-mannosaminyltransferase
MINKIVVGNIPIHLFTIGSLHQVVWETITHRRKKMFLHANARLVELANTNELWLQDFCNQQADYVMCDGSGIQLAARLSNQEVPKKIAYNIWIWIFAKFLVEHGFTMYLLGADQKTIELARKELERHVSGISVVGVHHGFFDKQPGSAETETIINQINDSKPDVLLVGFGMPLQERWIKDNYNRLNVHCIFTCGGAFDFISGNKQIAPKVFRSLYLEWLFRFMGEPIRLFHRVTTSFVRFGSLIAKQLLNKRKEEITTVKRKPQP